jgi:hypothetical protein
MHVSRAILYSGLMALCSLSLVGCPPDDDDDAPDDDDDAPDDDDAFTAVRFQFAMASGEVRLVEIPDIPNQPVGLDGRQPNIPIHATIPSGPRELVFVNVETEEEVVRATVDLPANGLALLYVTDIGGASVTSVTATETEYAELVDFEADAISSIQWSPDGDLNLRRWDESGSAYVDFLQPDFTEAPDWQTVSLSNKFWGNGGNGDCYCVFDTTANTCIAAGFQFNYSLSGSSDLFVQMILTRMQAGWDNQNGDLVDASLVGAPQLTRVVLGPSGGAGLIQEFACTKERYQADECDISWSDDLLETNYCGVPEGW